MEREENISVKPSGAAGEGKKLVNFVGDIKQELKRVEWTNKVELLSYTKIVLVATFLFGIGVYIVDLGIQSVLWTIQNLVRIITG